MNFYPFHIGDYISHTSHLTDAEDLAYRRLIDLYYQTESPLPHDLAMLARKVKSTPDIVDLLLNEFFEFVDGAWRSARADKEIAKYQYLSQSGKKGAEKRWANRDAKPAESPPNSPPIATPIATKNQEPLTNNQLTTIGSAKAPKATRLSLESLPIDWDNFCRSERPDLQPVAVWNQFKDYWAGVGGAKGTKLDWFATWRNWVRNQKGVTPAKQSQMSSFWAQIDGGGNGA